MIFQISCNSEGLVSLSWPRSTATVYRSQCGPEQSLTENIWLRVRCALYTCMCRLQHFWARSLDQLNFHLPVTAERRQRMCARCSITEKLFRTHAHSRTRSSIRWENYELRTQTQTNSRKYVPADCCVCEQIYSDIARIHIAIYSLLSM